MGTELNNNFYKYDKGVVSPNNLRTKNNTNKLTICGVLAKFDKDVRDFIIGNTFIRVGGTAYSLPYISEEKNVDFSFFKNAVICLADVLQKIKREDPDLFSTLKNLKTNESEFSFSFYTREKDWNDFEGNNYCGIYDNKYSNDVNLQAFNPSHRTYYHEIIHALDDGKLMNKGSFNPVELDHLSANLNASGLAKDIFKYRKKLGKEWKKDFGEFNEYWMYLKKYNCLKAEIDCYETDKEDRDTADKFYNICREKEDYLLTKRYWFYEYNFLTTCESIKRYGDEFFPYALKNNVELVACALEYLEYGTPEQKNMIKKDKELMDIIKRWKEFKPVLIE